MMISRSLRKLPERVDTKYRVYERTTWHIDLRRVLVRVEPEGERYCISRLTLDEIASACHEPVHLILADYGYARKEVIQRLRALQQRNEAIALLLADNRAGNRAGGGIAAPLPKDKRDATVQD